jgi:chromosome segregation ATPase
MNDHLITQNTIQIEFVPKQQYDELEKKLRDTEIRKKILEEQHAQTLLSIQTHIDTATNLRNENEMLRKEIANLNNIIINLTNEIASLNEKNNNLENKIAEIEIERLNEKKLLKINQCVYNYKDKIWKTIFENEANIKKREFGFDNLQNILKGKFDVELTDKQIENKNKIVNDINKNFTVNYLFNSFYYFTTERNEFSHPTIQANELNYLKNDFLEYCNIKWNDDNEANIKFTNYIFDVLQV